MHRLVWHEKLTTKISWIPIGMNPQSTFGIVGIVCKANSLTALLYPLFNLEIIAIVYF